MWQGGPRQWTGRPLGSAKGALYSPMPQCSRFGKYFNVLSSISTYMYYRWAKGNTCILIVFLKYLNVLSLGDGNTCICECILKYFDVFGVAFENTCINAVFLMYCKRIPIVRRIHVFQSCILLYPICIPEYMRIHENTSAIHMTYSALIEYVRIRCILRILLEYLTIFERKYTRF
jgi:alpha-D-ribose 1-methylphosphonate 5-phosphate C-P lyase